MAEFMTVSRRQTKVYKERRPGDDNNYRNLYRFSLENVEWLASHFLPPNTEFRGGALSNIQKMQTFLRYIADPGFQSGVGEDIGIHQCTVSRTTWEVCKLILTKANEWIYFPSTFEEMEAAKGDWMRKYKFPCVIGVIDCTHVMILKPSSHGDEYINRKGVCSFNVQVTYDANELAPSVDCEWPGSVHDSRIYRNSFVCHTISENPAGAILLAYEGYGIAPWLMTPYRNPSTPIANNFNKLHSKERVLIERVIGQVKRRFPILQSKIRLSTARIPSIIACCFILHNIAKHVNEPGFEEYDAIADTIDILDPTQNSNSTVKARSDARRDHIAEYILSAGNL